MTDVNYGSETEPPHLLPNSLISRIDQLCSPLQAKRNSSRFPIANQDHLSVEWVLQVSTKGQLRALN